MSRAAVGRSQPRLRRGCSADLRRRLRAPASSPTGPTTTAASATSCRRAPTAPSTATDLASVPVLGHLPAPRHRPALDVREPGLCDAGPDARRRSRTTSRTRRFGVPAGQAERTYSPRAGVTIVRDANFGVPHVYGVTRSDTMFGAGYAGAEDRLFFMDVLRHAGRAAAVGLRRRRRTRRWTPSVWSIAPYTEADLQEQFDKADDLYGAEGAQLQQDLTDYVAGINQYISEARTDPTKMPCEYAAIGKPLEDWKVTDVIAHRLPDRRHLRQGRRQRGRQRARARGGEEPLRRRRGRAGVARLPPPGRPRGAHHGAERQRLLRLPGASAAPRGVALPDPGSLVDPPNSGSSLLGAGALGGLLGGLGSIGGACPTRCSSRRRSRSPAARVAVMGPQVAYFMPQILMEEDLHGPDIDADGAAFPGVSLYVLLGRGQDFAWSATSAGQDIIDTFAEKLCEPDGSTPTCSRRTTSTRASACRWRSSPASNDITPNPGDPVAARDLHPRGAAHRARHRLQARHRGRRAGRLRAPALDLLPRGRLRARVLGAEPALEGAERAGLPARDVQDQLHLQLVLRRRPRHRLLQLGRQPGARAGRRPGPPQLGHRRVRLAGLRDALQDGGLHALRPSTRRSSTSPTSRPGTTSRRPGTTPPTTTTPTGRSSARSRSTRRSTSGSAAPAR